MAREAAEALSTSRDVMFAHAYAIDRFLPIVLSFFF